MRRVMLFLLLATAPAVLFAQSDIDRDRDDWRRRRYTVSDDRIELTPFGGYRWGGTIWADRSNLFGEDVDVASNGDYGVNLGIPVGISHMKLELMVNRQDTALQIAGGLFTPNDRLADMHITYYHAGLQIPLGDTYSSSPFIVLSAGIANLRPDIRGVAADNRFSASAGLGVKVPLNRNMGLRVEGRGYFTSLGENNDRCNRCTSDYGRDLYQGEANVGLVINF
jgi:outer membrane protein with beta-barrel domain